MEKEIVLRIQQSRWVPADEIFIFLTDYVSLFTLGILIIIALRVFYFKKDPPYYFYLSTLSLLISASITHLIKWLVHRPRPYQNSPFIHSLTSGGGWSFPSGHTAEVFTLVFSLWFLYKNPSLQSAILLWALFIAYTRIAFGVHYPSDILGGIAIAVFSVYVSKKILKKWHSFSSGF